MHENVLNHEFLFFLNLYPFKIDMKKLKEFNKTELDDLKFAIVMNGIKNHSTLPKYLDELVSKYNLDEEEQEILHTLFKEVYDYFNAD